MLTKKRLNYIFYAIFLISLFALLFFARKSLAYLVIGTIIAFIISPLVNLVDKRLIKLNLPKSASRVTSIVLVFIVLIFIAIVLLISIGDTLIQQFILILGQLEKTGLLERLNINIPDISQFESLMDFIDYNLALTQGDLFLDTLSIVSSTIAATVDVLFGVLILPFWMFYILYDPKSVIGAIGRLFPEKIKPDARIMLSLGNGILRSYIKGIFILSSTVTVMSTLGYSIIGLPNALGLGIIAGLLEMIPIFGPIIAAVIAIIVAIPMGWETVLLVLIWAIVVQQFENNILVPKILGKKIELKAWIVLIITTVGGALFGFVGMIIALPTAAILGKISQYIHLRLREDSKSPKETLKTVKKTPLSFEKF